jgi:hypothetical protein
MRCSAGASSINLQEYYGQQSVNCSDTSWNLAIAFAKHFKYTDMKNPYDTDGLSVYASTDECLGLGVATIWGSSNANQGKFVRVTTRFKEGPNSCSNNGREQTYVLIE